MSFGIAAIAAASGFVATAAAVSYTVGMVGLAMTGVGVVTGNAGMTKLGGELGLVGGIGSIGASLAGAGTAAATDVAVSQGVKSGVADASTQAGAKAVAGGVGTVAQNTAISAGNTAAGIGNSGNMINLANSGASVAPSASLANQLTGSTAASLGNSGTDYLGNAIGSGAPAASAGASAISVAAPAQATAVSSNANFAASNATNSSGLLGGSMSGTSPVLDQGLHTALNSAVNTGSPGLMSWFNGLPQGQQMLVSKAVLGGLGSLGKGYSAQQQLSLKKLANSQSMQKYNTAYTNANSVPSIKFNTPASTGLLNSNVIAHP